jgi:DNA-binding winged helix-turn-helix (wHTH) protein
MKAVAARPRNNSSMARDRSSWAATEAMLEFGRFRVLLRQRQLVADGVPIELGTRAFDLLLVLLDGDGSLVTKDELVSRVWPGIVVAEENLKVQIAALRKALGEDRDLIRTEFGRGYRLTAAVRSTRRLGSLSATAAQFTPKIDPPVDFPPIAAQSVCTEVAALILGPTGLAYDPEDDVLFVASTADNTIFAVPQCAKRKPADRQWRRGQRRSDPAERNCGIHHDGPLRSPV